MLADGPWCSKGCMLFAADWPGSAYPASSAALMLPSPFHEHLQLKLSLVYAEQHLLQGIEEVAAWQQQQHNCLRCWAEAGVRCSANKVKGWCVKEASGWIPTTHLNHSCENSKAVRFVLQHMHRGWRLGELSAIDGVLPTMRVAAIYPTVFAAALRHWGGHNCMCYHPFCRFYVAYESATCTSPITSER